MEEKARFGLKEYIISEREVNAFIIFMEKLDEKFVPEAIEILKRLQERPYSND